MKRLLLILLLALCATSLRADDGDWRNVRLFDWVYSGEAGYQMLKQAAEAAGEHGWVAQRLEKGQKVPQASARDLALQLEDSEKVDPALKESLKAQFADESGQLGKLDKVSMAEASAQLQASLDRASAKLDLLEASIKANSYGKGSDPGVSLNMYSMYREDAPSGLDQGDRHGYFGGGLEVTMNGTIGKTNFNLQLDGEYWYNQLSGTDYDSYNINGVQEALLDAGASFEIPFETGGLDVVLGQAQDLNLSPLLFSSLLNINRDAFYVDVTQSYRASKLVKTMELGYPADTYHFRGAYIKRTGSVWYWPFTTTEFVYTPADSTWWHNWDQKFTTTLLKLDEDIGPHGHWLDSGDIYAIISGSGSDQDQNNGAQVQGTNILQQYAKDYSLGTKIQFSSGSLFRADYALSSFYCLTNPAITNLGGSAWIASLVQPVGPLNMALEVGQASPGFQSAGHQYSDGQQAGATQDTLQMNRGAYDQAGIPGVTPNYWLLNNPNSFNHPVYTTMINQPGELGNNSQRMALKAEWHGSWVSVGLYDGITQQMLATDAYVMTSPYIEGSILNGYGWFRMLGQTFSPGPDPGNNGGAATQGGNMGYWLQGQFNSFTDSGGTGPAAPLQAIDSNGAKHPVHWQMLTQLNNYDAEFLVLLTKHGKGDLNLMPDSVKTLNYAGGNVMFDFAALSNRTEPLQLTIVGEDRDLTTEPTVPTMGGSSLFNQQFIEGFLNVGVSDSVTLVGMAGYEVWQTQQSYFPLFMQINEVGLGADYNADAVVTGLQFNLRWTLMNFHDSNIEARDLALQTSSLGCTLSY
jgi:hypothetical protein